MPYDIDQKPLGFAFVLAAQQVGIVSTVMASVLSINIHASLNFYIVSAIKDFCVSIKNLDQIVIDRAAQKIDDMEINRSFITILKFHYWIIQ